MQGRVSLIVCTSNITAATSAHKKINKFCHFDERNQLRISANVNQNPEEAESSILRVTLINL